MNRRGIAAEAQSPAQVLPRLPLTQRFWAQPKNLWELILLKKDASIAFALFRQDQERL